jgi:diguanylate cyclase (GGDEF)-like protein
MQQITRIENQDYSISPPLLTGDELEIISKNINQLAQTINEREASLKISRNELEYLSNHDVLTDLPNRRFFMNRLQHALDLALRSDNRLAIFFIDLDQFKLVNDTLGHDVGDELLVQVTRRLNRYVRTGDTLARIGGDEIYILIENAPSRPVLETIVQKYLQTFITPFHCFGHVISITASVGISIYPDNGEESVTLIKHADLAMYSSKDHGRNRYTFFSDELFKYASERAGLIHDLERAVETFEQFELYYQPKVNANTHQIVSIEALIRWNRPGYGLITPDGFISLTEEIGLINPIGEWALKKACSDFMALQQEGVNLQQVSVNVSSVQMKKSDMLSLVNQTIAETGIRPQQIELEITESYIATDVEQAIEILRTFNEKGVGVAIDDFGTGYSSMNYLQKLPITRLKIDKSFVDGLPHAKDSITITRAIISLAKSFNLALTAEGVENRGQLDFLIKEQCDEIQGNYFSKPLTKEELVQFYRNHLPNINNQSQNNVLTFSGYPHDDRPK